MMRRPPEAVPAAMVTAQISLTQRGILNSGVRRKWAQPGAWSRLPICVAEKRARAIKPMVFCASLLPWLNPRLAALRTCRGRKVRLMVEGRNRAKTR